MEKEKNGFYCWALLCLLSLLAYWIQINMMLHHDVAIISHTAGLILEGQTYAHDFFEPNPPLIFYLNFIPVIISKITGIKVVYVLRLYILALILVSVVCSRALFQVYFESNRTFIDVMTLGLACVLLFLPSEAFGQREHFLLILTTPYIFLAACRLDQKRVKTSFSLLIGIMAGIGFAIKPFFLTTFLLIELLFVYRKKSLWGWVRIESVAASIVMLSYGVSVLLFYPDYWQIVLPLWMPYYRAVVMPWVVLLTCPLFLFCCTALILWVFTAKETQYSMMRAVLGLSILGYLMTFLIPRVEWYYHLLPALSMACLYFLLVFCALLKGTFQQTLIILLAALVFSLPMQYSFLLTIRAIQFFHSNNPINQFIAFLKQYPKNKAYHFLSLTHHLSVLEFYTNAHYVGSFAFCSWEYGRRSSLEHSDTLSEVLKVTTQDLNKKKPDFVMVDIPSSQVRLNRIIDFPKEYAHDKGFRDAWSHYRYVDSIAPYAIYQRVDI